MATRKKDPQKTNLSITTLLDQAEALRQKGWKDLAKENEKIAARLKRRLALP